MVEHCSLLQITSASTAFSPLDTEWIASGGMFKVFFPGIQSPQILTSLSAV
jgi:hypothetical protein